MGFTDPAQDSKMPSPQPDSLLQVETTCGTLLYELQIIWDEVGEADADRDKMLFELEQECLEVYRRKVDQANRCRAQLRRAIADSEAELAAICSAMGERPVHIRQTDQAVGSLKEELALIIPQVEEMRKRKTERKNQFIEILGKIQNLQNELNGSTEFVSHGTVDYEADLSLRKLEEYQRQLHSLNIEKSDRLQQIEEHLNTLESLCSVMGMDFNITVNEINPSLGNSEASKSISNATIQKLDMAIQKLRDIKIQRMQKLQDLATALLELWNLMDTPVEEQQRFQKVTANLAASEHEITEPNILSEDLLSFVEAEVSRLEEFKLSKMKELVLKKRSELEEICRKTHLIPESDSCFEDTMDAIESGTVDAAMVLEQIEVQIARIKEEALGRKEVLEKVEKWLAACDEECWLEEYNRDENRYNAGKGTHLVLKRAEKARALVNKLPGMVETLASKTIQWENETGVEFLYDGIRLLSMLEEYTLLRQEKEQERQRLRDQKKLQGQLIAEQEALYGSKPSPSKPQSVKKGHRFSTGGANSRRVSMGGAVQQTPKRESFHSTKATPRPRTSKKTDKILQNDLQFNHRLNNGFAASSGARRGIDMADVAVKKQLLGAVNAKEEAELVRKPFSPISLKASSRANSVANIDDHGDSCLQKMIPSNDPLCTTPLKTITALADEEIRTPKATHIPMQTAMTPASVPIPVLVKPVEANYEEIEYSFEEKRLAFMMSNSQSTVQA